MGMRKSSKSGWCLGVAMRVLGCGALLGTAGCGADADGNAEALGLIEQDLNPPSGWRLWSVAPNNSGSTATFADSPGVCLATPDGVVIVGRDATTGRFRTLVNEWRLFSSPPWADFGTTTFASKPACTSLDEVRQSPPAPNNQIAVFGRGTDNKFYARTALVDTTVGDWPNDPPTQPAVKLHTHKISDVSYASAPGTTVAFGKLLVVGRRSDNNLISLHQNTLSTSTTTPYSNSNWQTAVSAPALPTSWVAAGDPVIANTVPFTGVAMVLTRASFGSSNRLYYIFWNGTSFQGPVSADTWERVPTGTTVVRSDPAVEVDLRTGMATVFIRGATTSGGMTTNANRIFEASGLGPNLWSAFSLVRQEDGDTFTASPAAVGNGNFEGQHMVVAKKSNNQFYWTTPVPF